MRDERERSESVKENEESVRRRENVGRWIKGRRMKQGGELEEEKRETDKKDDERIRKRRR